MATPVHLRPTATLAPRALLPGDPGRALALAQALLDKPLMFNHHRGLWGYTGTAADGRPLTIQSLGLGAPSAAIVLEELCDLGLEVAVRVGTATALDDGLALGAVLAVPEALADDGTSRALGADGLVGADPELTRELVRAAGAQAVAAGADVFYDPEAETGQDRRRAAGARLVDLPCAAVLQVARRRGLRAGCLLAVARHASGGPALDEDGLEAAGLALGEVAATALGIPARAPREAGRAA